MGHRVSFTTTQLYHHSMKEAMIHESFVIQYNLVYKNRLWVGFGLWAWFVDSAPRVNPSGTI